MTRSFTLAGTTDQWLHRCAQRLEQRYQVMSADALELAAEVLRAAGPNSCPERVADASWRLLGPV